MHAHFATLAQLEWRRPWRKLAFYDDTKLELKSFQLNPMEAKTAKSGDYINHFTSGKKELEADAKQKMAYIS